MDEQALTKWAQENEIIHGLLHAGIQKTIIDMRAKARPTVNVKTGETKSIVKEKAAAQEALNDFVVKPTPKPGTSSKALTVDKALELAEKLSPEKLAEMLAKLQAMQAKE